MNCQSRNSNAISYVSLTNLKKQDTFQGFLESTKSKIISSPMPATNRGSIYERGKNSVKQKDVKIEIQSILNTMYSTKECTFSPKTNMKCIKLTTSFLERQNIAKAHKEELILAKKMQEEDVIKKIATFRPKIINIAHNSICNKVLARCTNKMIKAKQAGYPTSNDKTTFSSPRNRKYEMLYEEAKARKKRKELRTTVEVPEHSITINPQSTKIFITKLKDELDCVIGCNDNEVVEYDKFVAIMNEICPSCDINSIWKLCQHGEQCKIYNVKHVLHIIFGVTKQNQYKKCEDSQQTKKFTNEEIEHIKSKYSTLRLQYYLKERTHESNQKIQCEHTPYISERSYSLANARNQRNADNTQFQRFMAQEKTRQR